jgi:hypothetical protein
VYEPAIATVNLGIQRVQALVRRDGHRVDLPGRELALALTRLEEAEMWLQRAQARAPQESEL